MEGVVNQLSSLSDLEHSILSKSSNSDSSNIKSSASATLKQVELFIVMQLFYLGIIFVIFICLKILKTKFVRGLRTTS